MVDIYLKESDRRFTVNKDPNSNLDYTWDWSAYLTAISDTISSFVIETPDSMSVSSSAIVGDNKVVAYINGGTLGEVHKVTCRITTAAGRVDERSIYFNMIDR